MARAGWFENCYVHFAAFIPQPFNVRDAYVVCFKEDLT